MLTCLAQVVSLVYLQAHQNIALVAVNCYKVSASDESGVMELAIS